MLMYNDSVVRVIETIEIIIATISFISITQAAQEEISMVFPILLIQKINKIPHSFIKNSPIWTISL